MARESAANYGSENDQSRSRGPASSSGRLQVTRVRSLTPHEDGDDSHDHIDLLLDEDLRVFRRQVRSFLRHAVPAETRRRIDNGYAARKPEITAFVGKLAEKGWTAPGWPVEYGGTGWSQLQRFVYAIELGGNAVPSIPPFGTSMVGPVIYTFGSQAQKDLYLPRIISGEDFWCQGFSEPGAGSDLAALKTRAELRDDHYLLNGQKIWTSKAHYADRIFLLARTDEGARKQDGISFFVLDMDTPGIEIRPIVSIDMTHSLNEVFFTDVKIPLDGIVGERGKGWSYAKFLLGNERSGITNIGRCRRQVARLRRVARASHLHRVRLHEDAAFLRDLARIEADLTALEITEIRLLCEGGGSRFATSGPSVLKLQSARIQQELGELMVAALGAYAAARGEAFVEAFVEHDGLPSDFMDGAMSEYLYGRATSIYGGTDQIQREIIAKAELNS